MTAVYQLSREERSDLLLPHVGRIVAVEVWPLRRADTPDLNRVYEGRLLAVADAVTGTPSPTDMVIVKVGPRVHEVVAISTATIRRAGLLTGGRALVVSAAIKANPEDRDSDPRVAAFRAQRDAVR